MLPAAQQPGPGLILLSVANYLAADVAVSASLLPTITVASTFTTPISVAVSIVVLHGPAAV